VSSSRAAGVFLLWCTALAGAAEPTLTHLFPAAGTQGTTVSVTAGGKMEPWPPNVWVDAPGIDFRPSKTKGKFDVEIGKDAAVGPHLVRVTNAEGASAPRFFIVSGHPELLETEPNNESKAPQKIARLPATISGRLDKAGDVDAFAVTLQKGQALTAGVEAYVLGSNFDGLLRITDADGNQLAFNHDGRTLDPLLTWQAPKDGTYVVQIMGFVYPATAGVGFHGGEGSIYRLHLTTAASPPVKLPPHDATLGAESPEQEPNDALASPQTIALPGAVAGAIQKAGDEDRFAFTAVKGRAYELKLVAARAGSPLDAWLKIENKEGKEIARNDDAAGARDPQLTWTAPSDGVFTAAIGDVTQHGGADFIYRLTVAEARPAVTGSSASASLTVTGGKTGEIKATVKRVNGFKAKLQLAAKALPAGVTVPEVEVPAKDGEVILKVVADPTALAASQPVQLVLREAESGTEYPVPFSMTTTGENNGVPGGYTELVIDSTDQLWLTVISVVPKPEPPQPEPAKPEPPKPAPAKPAPEPAKSEPAKPAPPKPEPAKPEAPKPEPAKAKPPTAPEKPATP
jgi:hypothetical protein